MTDPRKRTSSFSLPSPTKQARTDSMTSSLRRTESLLSILPSDHQPMRSDEQQLPYYKTLQYHKDQRLKRQQSATHDNARASSSSSTLYSPSSLSLALTPPLKPKHKAKRVPAIPCPPLPQPSSPPKRSRSTPPPPQAKPHTQIFLPSARPLILTLRTSSPLSPHSRSPPSSTSTPSNSYRSPSPSPSPPVRIHPRSRPEPDLYRKAIKQHMGTSPEGRKVLTMGPRLAMSIANATRELERIVAAGLITGVASGGGAGDYWDDADVLMGDSTMTTAGLDSGLYPSEKSGVPPVLTNSWVLVRGEDWEMVDCAA